MFQLLFINQNIRTAVCVGYSFVLTVIQKLEAEWWKVFSFIMNSAGFIFPFVIYDNYCNKIMKHIKLCFNTQYFIGI